MMALCLAQHPVNQTRHIDQNHASPQATGRHTPAQRLPLFKHQETDESGQGNQANYRDQYPNEPQEIAVLRKDCRSP